MPQRRDGLPVRDAGSVGMHGEAERVMGCRCSFGLCTAPLPSTYWTMFGRPRTLTCPGGEWTTVVRSQFAQMPATWTIRMHGDPIAGEYEETKSAWVFPGTPSIGPLDGVMTFERGYWNTFYTVRLRPTDTVTVTVE